jgi:pyruvate/2-oxoglutarate dehydrogenase complex dihydrolipoamide acyltransferase (E2) component
MPRPIMMPSLGMYTAEGTLTTWLRPDGAEVAAGEPIAEITTEKATYELEAPAAGRLHTVAAPGVTLPVQAVLGYVLAPGEAPPAGPGSGGAGGTHPHPSPLPPGGRGDSLREREGAAIGPGKSAAAPTAAGPLSQAWERAGGEGATQPPAPEIKASPVARRLAAQHGIDLARLTGSGPGGRIVEADVLAAVARQAEAAGAATAPPARRIRQRLPLAGMRRTIAERLRHSLTTTAPVTLMREVDAEALVAARGQLGERLGRPVPYDALFVKLFALALRERPELNAVIEQEALLLLDEVHIGFAVAVPGGLLVPVVRDADARPLAEIVAAMAALGEQARAGQLRPADIEGGTATITNLGAYGVDAFTPILNPPQAAILGIGRIRPRPVWQDGQWVARQACALSLTFDHRVADGAPAAELLAAVARRMGDAAALAALA